MFKEFKAFALKGNVIDLAIGVIIGGAFGKIVTSLVNDVIMPLVGLFTGNINYSNMFVVLKGIPDGVTVVTAEDAKKLNLPTLNYGAFLTQVIDFLIMALVIFFFIKLISHLSKLTEKVIPGGAKKDVPPPPKTTKICPFCCSEIKIEATRCPHCTSQLDE